ncbi:hypothetical protein ACFQL7_03560 [Halocatena marina]|uniref:Uncharacterized protein n=1 Tax=Halocatena marina TaxID=2934937 RepID=A0ABD5YRF4_9EURY
MDPDSKELPFGLASGIVDEIESVFVVAGVFERIPEFDAFDTGDRG